MLDLKLVELCWSQADAHQWLRVLGKSKADDIKKALATAHEEAAHALAERTRCTAAQLARGPTCTRWLRLAAGATATCAAAHQRPARACALWKWPVECLLRLAEPIGQPLVRVCARALRPS